MKRVLVLVAVAVAGMALAGCERQDSLEMAANDPRLNGLSPSNMGATDPTILEDQKQFYKSAPAAATPDVAPAASQPAASQGAANATTAPATAPATQPG